MSMNTECRNWSKSRNARAQAQLPFVAVLRQDINVMGLQHEAPVLRHGNRSTCFAASCLFHVCARHKGLHTHYNVAKLGDGADHSETSSAWLGTPKGVGCWGTISHDLCRTGNKRTKKRSGKPHHCQILSSEGTTETQQHVAMSVKKKAVKAQAWPSTARHTSALAAA